LVELEKFYTNVKVTNDYSRPLGQRLKALLENVIQRLPNEEQFQMKGMIFFNTRSQAIEFWEQMRPKLGFGPDLRPYNRDGNCTYAIGPTVQDSMFAITIIIDNLDFRSDDYIKGLLAHEFSEMSHAWRITQKEMPTLLKMKPKARLIKMDQLTKQNSDPSSKEYAEHEKNVNDEAERLGFRKEIDVLEHAS